MIKKILIVVGLILVGAVIVLQLIPYGRNHSNPPVTNEPAWDNPETRALAVRACFNCHSNETVWPWYSNIAPFSWLVQRDVDEGREYLNFSEWGSNRFRELDEIGEVIQEGYMPPSQFLITHPEARLTVAEKEKLTQGLMATLRSR